MKVKFSFEMSGDFVKENGKIFAFGAVTCGVIVTSGVTYGAVYAVTKNGAFANEVASNVAKIIPKSA
ncbi:hypothetical protein ACFO3D_15455 [Virgibacillus kekensis]|uniref:Uncharacterized protein n=1 Tax=Virgibacillus kekensis TaxID=202261 RepID=A0ABV9DP34_9BACI